jgi:hypothetical protein
MQSGKLLFLPLLLMSIGLTSCGRIIQASYAALDGNWHIAGEQGNQILPPLQSPLLTFAIGGSGDTVYANGNVGVICSSGSSAIGGGVELTGQIASDGTFLLSNSAFPLDSIQITIQGKVPAPGSTTWSGSYTVTNGPTAIGCSFNLSGDFVASLYPPLDGTYSGTITGQGLGSGITVTTQITQGTFTSITLSPSARTIYFIPLTATITVSGSSSYTTGTTTASQLLPGSSSIGGNSFALTFLMNNGSTLTLSGWFSDPSESTLQIEGPLSSSGSVFGSGTLTRQ